MYELNGTLKDLNFDYQTGKALLTFAIEQKQSAINCWDKLRDAERLTVKVDKHRERRSINANNYAWALLTEIGNVMRLNKDDVYFLMLQRYGQCEMISVKDGIPIGDYVKYCVRAGESWLNDTLFKHYKVYKGSSEFTKEEMAVFIDGVVQEAQDLNIETRTPDEIAKLKDLWGA